MSATSKTAAEFGAGAVAQVSFRVKCESLGHGEEVFLVAQSEQGVQRVSVRFASTSHIHRSALLKLTEVPQDESVKE